MSLPEDDCEDKRSEKFDSRGITAYMTYSSEKYLAQFA